MPILVHQLDDTRFSIQCPEELTLILSGFLEKQDQVKITTAAPKALVQAGTAKGAGMQLPDHCGYIEGSLESAAHQVRDLVQAVADHFQFTIESGSSSPTAWTLYSRQEADYNDHFGI